MTFKVQQGMIKRRLGLRYQRQTSSKTPPANRSASGAPKSNPPMTFGRRSAKSLRLPGVTGAPKLQPIETRLVMLRTGMRAPMGIKVKAPDARNTWKTSDSNSNASCVKADYPRTRRSRKHQRRSHRRQTLPRNQSRPRGRQTLRTQRRRHSPNHPNRHRW